MPKVNFTKTRKAAYKEANVRSIKKNEEIICNIVPTAFAVNKELLLLIELKEKKVLFKLLIIGIIV